MTLILQSHVRKKPLGLQNAKQLHPGKNLGLVLALSILVTSTMKMQLFACKLRFLIWNRGFKYLWDSPEIRISTASQAYLIWM